MLTVSSAFRATAAPVVAGLLLLAPASTVPQARPAALDDAAIVATSSTAPAFGARAEDVARVRELGLDRYLDEQLHPETPVRRRGPRPARRIRDARARFLGNRRALLRAAAARAPRQQEGRRPASRPTAAPRPATEGGHGSRPSARACASCARPAAS